MQIFPVVDAPGWQQGLFAGTSLSETIYADPLTGDPALTVGVPTNTATVYPAYTLISGGFATGNGGNAWTVHNRYLTTDQTSDTLTFTVPAGSQYVDIITAGALYPDMIDAHGLAWPYASDGQAAQNSTTGPLSPEQIQGGTIYTLTVDGASAGSIDSALGVQSIRITVSATGTHAVILTNTGSQTVSHPVHRLTMVGVVVTPAGLPGSGGTWASPVYDSGDDGTVWVGLDYDQAAPGSLTQAVLTINGATWTRAYSGGLIVDTLPAPNGATTPYMQEGVPHAAIAFAQNALPGGAANTQPIGRFAQLTLTVPGHLATPAVGGSLVPWIRNLYLYTTTPQTDRVGVLRLPPTLYGPLVQATQAAYGAVLTKLHYRAAQMIQSYAIGTATGPWLLQYGVEQAIPMAPGIGQAAYAAQLQAALAGKSKGPSATFVATQVGAYIGAPVMVSGYGSAAQHWQYTLKLPLTWPNPVTAAQIMAFVLAIQPAGNIPTIHYGP